MECKILHPSLNLHVTLKNLNQFYNPDLRESLKKHIKIVSNVKLHCVATCLSHLK